MNRFEYFITFYKFIASLHVEINGSTLYIYSIL